MPTPDGLRKFAASLYRSAEMSAAHVAATHQLIDAASIMLADATEAILRHRQTANETALIARVLAKPVVA